MKRITLQDLTPAAIGRRVRVYDRETTHEGVLSLFQAEADKIVDLSFGSNKPNFTIGHVGVRLAFLDRWDSPMLPLDAVVEFIED